MNALERPILSRSGVKEHLASIFGKLGMDNCTAAADAAQRRRNC